MISRNTSNAKEKKSHTAHSNRHIQETLTRKTKALDLHEPTSQPTPAANASNSYFIPPLAKSLATLSFPFKAKEDEEEPTSAHKNNKAIIGPLDGEKWTHFFKNYNRVSLNEPKASIAEAEVAIGAVCKFLAPENVPTMRVYYDEKTFEVVGNTSKVIPNFKSNFDDPLQEKDTIVQLNIEGMQEEEIAKQQYNLNKSIKLLLQCIDQRYAQVNSYFPGLSYIKSVCNYHINANETSIKFREKLLAFQKEAIEVKFSEKKVNELLQHLRTRYNYILEQLKDEAHQSELCLLKHTLDITDFLYRLTAQKTIPLSAIPFLELMDEEAKQENINLDDAPERIFEKNCAGKQFSITANHLKNYRIVKRQTIGLVVRYLMQDPDGHNQNMTKDGWLIDFDMAKLKFLFTFREAKFWDQFLRSPNDDMFILTPLDILEFPYLKNANYYFWPTNQRVICSSVVEEVSHVNKKSGNYFKAEHAIVFKNLVNNPITIFHKYKEFLKYCLMDKKVNEGLLGLHLRTFASFVDKKDGKVKKLLSEMVNDEAERIKQIRTILINLPQFQEVIKEQGEFIFKLIKQEYLQSKYKIEAKIKNPNTPRHQIKPLTDLANAINLEEIEANYRQILLDAKNAGDNAKLNSPKNKEHETGWRFKK